MVQYGVIWAFPKSWSDFITAGGLPRIARKSRNYGDLRCWLVWKERNQRVLREGAVALIIFWSS